MTEEPSFENPDEENESYMIKIDPPQLSSPHDSRDDDTVKSFIRNKNSARKKACVWEDSAVKLLYHYLKENKKIINHQDGELKKKLWTEASTYLQTKGFVYTPKEIVNKWNNEKQIYKVKMLNFFLFL